MSVICSGTGFILSYSVCLKMLRACALRTAHVPISPHTNVKEALWLEHSGLVIAGVKQCLFFSSASPLSCSLWGNGGINLK